MDFALEVRGLHKTYKEFEPEQRRGGTIGWPDRPGEAAGARRQRRVEIDGCLKRQNPAYRLTCTKNRHTQMRMPVFCLLDAFGQFQHSAQALPFRLFLKCLSRTSRRRRRPLPFPGPTALLPGSLALDPALGVAVYCGCNKPENHLSLRIELWIERKRSFRG